MTSLLPEPWDANTFPVWFGPADLPLAGWLHLPAGGKARGSVLICPPVGHEYLQAHPSLRLLAEVLSADGFCCLRMDYHGTGDSAGEIQPGHPLEDWATAARQGLDLLAKTAPGAPMFAVGMGVGATVVFLAAQDGPPLEGVVAWDPVISGRAWLSEQHALYLLSLPAAPEQDEDVFRIPGASFGPEAAKELKRFRLSPAQAARGARNLLVLSRPQVRDFHAREAVFDGPSTDWGEAPEQAALLEHGSVFGVVAHISIEDSRAWLSKHALDAGVALAPPPAAGRAVIGHSQLAGNIYESPVWTSKSHLFGVLTEPERQADGPTIVFLPAATCSHVGVDRLWVELARRWASLGWRSLRLDVSGLGESPTRRPSQRPLVPAAPESFDDIAEACAAVSPSDPSRVVLVGLSTGAYQALESGLELNPAAVVALNPVLAFYPPERETTGRTDPRRRIALPLSVTAGPDSWGYAHGQQEPTRRYALLYRAQAGVSQWLARHGTVARAREAQRAFMNDLNWRYKMWRKPSRKPVEWMAALLEGGTRVTLSTSPFDERPVLLKVPPARLREWQSVGLQHYRVTDHLLRAPGDRVDLFDAITADLSALFTQSWVVGATASGNSGH